MRENLKGTLTEWIDSLQRIVGLLNGLDETEWEKIERVMRNAEAVLGDPQRAARWIIKVHPRLRATPLAFVLMGEDSQVDDLLARIKHSRDFERTNRMYAASHGCHRRRLRRRLKHNWIVTTVDYQRPTPSDSSPAREGPQ